MFPTHWTMAMPYQPGLDTVKGILDDPKAFQDGRPQFRSVSELKQYFEGKGFRLTNATPYGDVGDPDAVQLIYEGPNNVIAKVKTRGYPNGPRANIPTMSFEVTDGKGTGWDNALFKVDAKGKIVAKDLVIVEELVRFPDGTWGKKNFKGEATRFSYPTLIDTTIKNVVVNNKPIDGKKPWADRGHLNLPDDFNPAGAGNLVKNLNPGPRASRFARTWSFLKNHRKVVAGSAAFVGTSILLVYLRGKLDQKLFESQMKALEPKIRDQVRKRKQEIAEILAQGRQPYANVTVTVIVIEVDEVEGGDRVVVQSSPHVSLESISVSDQDIQAAGATKTERYVGTKEHSESYTFSVPVGPEDIGLSSSDIEFYAMLKAKLEWYEERLTDASLPLEERIHIFSERSQAKMLLWRWGLTNREETNEMGFTGARKGISKPLQLPPTGQPKAYTPPAPPRTPSMAPPPRPVLPPSGSPRPPRTPSMGSRPKQPANDFDDE